MPTPYWPIAGSVRPCAPQARRRNASGSWIRMPAPSPCSGSAPVAPRWVRFLRIDSPCVMIAWRLLALDVGDEAEAAGVVLVARGRTDPGAPAADAAMPAESFFHDDLTA